MRKLLIGTAIVLVVGVIALFVIMPSLTVGVAQSDTETAVIQRMTLNDTVESSGAVSAERTAYLMFGASGIVESVTVDVGDTVREGDSLAALDTTDLALQVALREDAVQIAQTTYDQLLAGASEREIAQAQANVAAAESQLTTARTSQTNAPDQVTASCASAATAGNALDIARTAYDAYLEAGFALDLNFTADPDAEAVTAYENAQSSYDAASAQCMIAANNAANADAAVASAEANLAYAQAVLADLLDGADADQITIAAVQLEQAQTQLEQAQAALDRAALTAPFDGVITAVNIEVGQAAGMTSAAITLVDTSAYYLSVDVDELDVMRLEIGQSAEIALEALDGQIIPGTLTRIAPAPNPGAGVVTYNVRVDLILDGMTAASSSTSERGAAINSLDTAQAARVREFLPIVEELGGLEGLVALSEQPDGNAQFIAALRDGGIDETVIAQIESVGGLDMILQVIEANTDLLAPSTAAPASIDGITLRIGMTADVEIVVGTFENVFVVTSEAIQRTGDQEYLIPTEGDNIPVTTGLSRDGLTIVYGDLTEGQTVYVQPPPSRTDASPLGIRRLAGAGS